MTFMSTEPRQPYLIDMGGYAHGPYASESDAYKVAEDGDRVEWLTRNDISEEGVLA